MMVSDVHQGITTQGLVQRIRPFRKNHASFFFSNFITLSKNWIESTDKMMKQDRRSDLAQKAKR